MIDAAEVRAAEKYFHHHIPLTRAMGLRVVANEENGFAIEAPVALNYNHMRSAFGGSINAAATLAGYGMLWLQLRSSAAHVVIAESSIRFLRPVRTTIRARCDQLDAGEWERFRSALRTSGKARIKLQVRVEEESVLAARFEGVFVATTQELA
ncbi:MAG: YiiD C-terminal domain-containing protein [Chthoniobacterales bacterium]